ncbi:hypothetical protein [Streptomyces sp. MCC20]|uniref:hypothetical protein n=1 Tax=Streptomyces sediminimaris TaxID=3383721 RepID=UPI00399A3FE9
MTTSSFTSSRTRRIARAVGTLIVIALPAVLLALVVGAGVPDAWWPQTGQAFAADQPHTESGARRDPCDLIVGPAKEYCERGHHTATTSSAAAGKAPHEGAGAAWMVIPPVAGLAAVVVWRSRGAARHGRR